MRLLGILGRDVQCGSYLVVGDVQLLDHLGGPFAGSCASTDVGPKSQRKVVRSVPAEEGKVPTFVVKTESHQSKWAVTCKLHRDI